MNNNPSTKHIRPRIRTRTKSTKASIQKDEDLDALLLNIRQRMTLKDSTSPKFSDIQKITESSKKDIPNKSKPSTSKKNLKAQKWNVIERTNPTPDQDLLSQPLQHQTHTKKHVSFKESSNNSPQKIEMDVKGAQIFAASNIEGYHAALEKYKEREGIKKNVSTQNPSHDLHLENDKTCSISWHRDYFESDTDNDEYNDNSDDDDDDDDSNDSYEEIKAEPKPFILFWEALSGWITPESIKLIQLWQSWHQCQINELKELCIDEWEQKQAELLYQLKLPTDRSDIGVSRCKGLMSMLMMHLPKCMDEYFDDLKSIKTQHWMTRQMMEQRLSNLCQSFDYTYPMVKLNIDPRDAHKTTLLWRALCCILIHIVIGGNETNIKNRSLPDSVWNVGIGRDEYYYLIEKAMTTLNETNE